LPKYYRKVDPMKLFGFGRGHSGLSNHTVLVDESSSEDEKPGYVQIEYIFSKSPHYRPNPYFIGIIVLKFPQKHFLKVLKRHFKGLKLVHRA